MDHVLLPLIITAALLIAVRVILFAVFVGTVVLRSAAK